MLYVLQKGVALLAGALQAGPPVPLLPKPHFFIGIPLFPRFCIFLKCKVTDQEPGDGLDNDCDGKIDEEVFDGKDNDDDGKIDEDLELVRFQILSQLTTKKKLTVIYMYTFQTDISQHRQFIYYVHEFKKSP